ncbi:MULTISPECIES: hypothetical protein [Rhizobium/Agrobacterium group]|uniref:hypothetical protein n=1 Tax=Rhizobium/Agrobacterium group TaxID=227290 RepID=UPI0023013B7C|nr:MULTISPECIES: hypothetical protein [Rhizobium/Agrobacterium group]MDA5633408.1 hypothetical protein [Agrobacterium sp. ST15.16.024]MDF1889052.1 hypothetical protein [Rhizobium rhizogenes]
MTVFRKGNHCRAVVNARGVDKPLYTRDVFDRKEDAQRAAFDTLSFAEERAEKLTRRQFPSLPWVRQLRAKQLCFGARKKGLAMSYEPTPGTYGYLWAVLKSKNIQVNALWTALSAPLPSEFVDPDNTCRN